MKNVTDLSTPIEKLGLSTRAIHYLKNRGVLRYPHRYTKYLEASGIKYTNYDDKGTYVSFSIKTLGDLLYFPRKFYLNIRNIGEKTVSEIEEKVMEVSGHRLGDLYFNEMEKENEN